MMNERIIGHRCEKRMGSFGKEERGFEWETRSHAVRQCPQIGGLKNTRPVDSVKPRMSN